MYSEISTNHSKASTFGCNIITLLMLELEGQRPQLIAELRNQELSTHVEPVSSTSAIQGYTPTAPKVWEDAHVSMAIRPLPGRYGGRRQLLALLVSSHTFVQGESFKPG